MHLNIRELNEITSKRGNTSLKSCKDRSCEDSCQVSKFRYNFYSSLSEQPPDGLFSVNTFPTSKITNIYLNLYDIYGKTYRPFLDKLTAGSYIFLRYAKNSSYVVSYKILNIKPYYSSYTNIDGYIFIVEYDYGNEYKAIDVNAEFFVEFYSNDNNKPYVRLLNNNSGEYRYRDAVNIYGSPPSGCFTRFGG